MAQVWSNESDDVKLFKGKEREMKTLIAECSVKGSFVWGCGILGYGVHKPAVEVKATVREHSGTGGAMKIHSWTELGRT